MKIGITTKGYPRFLDKFGFDNSIPVSPKNLPDLFGGPCF